MFGAREKEAEVDSTIILAATAGAFLLAGFVKGVIGLGLPTVSIGLLGLLMTPAQAAAILVVPSLVTNIWQAVVGGGLVALLRRLWPMLIGICLGTFVDVVLLPHDDTGQATIWLGVALALYSALGLVNVHFSVPRHAENLAWPRHGRGDGRDHGSDRHLRHAGHSVHPIFEVRTRQACAGTWPVVFRVDDYARFGARL